MSNEFTPFTAYESPSPADDAKEQASRSEVPLKVPCIIAAVLGGGGLATGLMALAGVFFSQSMQTAFAPSAGTGPQEIMRIQQQMQTAMNAIQDRFFALNLSLAIVHLLVAGFLLAGAVRCMRRSRQGPKWLLAACSSAAVYEIICTIAQLPMQLQTMSATNFYMELMFDSSGNVPSGVLEFSVLATKVLLFASMLLGFAWVLAKVLFYFYTARQLRRPEIRAAFSPPMSH